MQQEQEASEIKLHALDYWQVLRNRWGIILLTFLLILISAAVITYLLPKQYVGKVVLEVKGMGNDINVFDRTQTVSQNHSRYFLETQFEIIKSKETLYDVIDDLGLVERWGVENKAQAFGALRGHTEANPVRGTELLEIEVYSQDYREAADLANAIADTYRSRRMNGQTSRKERSIQALDLEFGRAKESMDQARTRMHDIAQKYGIAEIGSSQHAYMKDIETGNSSILGKSRLEVFDTRTSVESLRSNLRLLGNLEGEELIKTAASLDIQDNTLTERYRSYNDAQLIEQNLIDSNLGKRHPKVIAVRNQISKLHEMLLESAQTVKRSFEYRLEMAENQLANAESMQEETQTDSIDEKRRLVEYQEAKTEYEMAKDIVASIDSKRATERVEGRMPITPIEIHEVAEPDPTPRKPRVNLNLMLGSAVGLLFGIGIALFLEYLDTSVKSLEEVERYLGVPVLAVIPQDVGVLHRQSVASPDAEAYRILRTNIEFNRKNSDANALTVVSGAAGEGKSTTIVNLAYICAQGGYSTLLIDGDLRRPSLHRFFDIGNSFGLTNFLASDDIPLEQVVLQTPVDNLYFLPSGVLPADAAGILNSRKMSELIQDVKSRFDIVLVDSPPILGVSDASVLCSEVDQTIIVIQHRKLPRNMLVRVKDAIESVGGSVIGAVLNNVDVRSDNQYQYYTSYYTYYSPTNGAAEETAQIAPAPAPPMADVAPPVAPASDYAPPSQAPVAQEPVLDQQHAEFYPDHEEFQQPAAFSPEPVATFSPDPAAEAYGAEATAAESTPFAPQQGTWEDPAMQFAPPAAGFTAGQPAQDPTPFAPAQDQFAQAPQQIAQVPIPPVDPDEDIY